MEKKQAYLVKKAASDAEQHEQILAAAKKDLEVYYEEHQQKISQKLQENQSASMII